MESELGFGSHFLSLSMAAQWGRKSESAMVRFNG
jgi:hypothetical protein